LCVGYSSKPGAQPALGRGRFGATWRLLRVR
jgi:hypothetical protein